MEHIDETSSKITLLNFFSLHFIKNIKLSYILRNNTITILFLQQEPLKRHTMDAIIYFLNLSVL